MVENDVALRDRLYNAVDSESGVDWLNVHENNGVVDIVIAGRDCPTEHSNAGERLADVSTEDGDTFAVCFGEGEERGYTVTDLQATGLSLGDAMAMAAEYVRDEA